MRPIYLTILASMIGLFPTSGTFGEAPLSSGVTRSDRPLRVPSLVMDGGTLSPVDLYGRMPANFAGISGAGPIFSMGCLTVGCPTVGGKAYDSQRAQQFIETTTQADASKQEYSSYLHMNAVTGKAPFWTRNTKYSADTQVTYQSNVYKAKGSCTSGNDRGPIGTSVDHEGTCSWAFGGEMTNGKTTLGVSMYSGPNSGSAWGAAINAVRINGDPTRFTTGLEIDNTIDDHVDHVPGSSTGDAYGIIQSGFNSAGSTGTIAHAISSANSAGTYAWHCAFCVIAVNVAKDTGFGNGSNAADGFLNNAASNASGGFHDAGGTRAAPNPLGFYATGYYGAAAFDTTGARTGTAFRAKAGQKICFNVDDDCLQKAPSGFQFVHGGNIGLVVDAADNLRVLGAVSSISRPPTVAACGKDASISGTSQAGVVTIGSGEVTACIIKLAVAVPTPFAGCTLTPANANATGPKVGAYAAPADRTTTRWIIRGADLAGAAFNYVCM